MSIYLNKVKYRYLKEILKFVKTKMKAYSEDVGLLET